MIRVFIADSHPVVREGLRAVLGSDEGIEIVGEADSGVRAWEVAPSLRPDVVVVELSMAMLDGLALIRKWRARGLDGGIVVLSLHNDQRSVLAALDAGARAYVLKTDSVDRIRDAVLAVARGDSFLSPDVAETSSEETHPAPEPEPAFTRLTPREREVLELISNGLEAKEAADQLGLKHKTVLAVRLRLMRKLDVHSVAGLTRYALRHGVTSLQA